MYRLAEITFGSLVASFIVGFGLASHRYPFDSGSLNGLLAREPVTTAVYLFISAAYFIGTAGLFITYHVGILTLPTLQFRHVLLDFGIAGMLGAFFTLSMLFPQTFMVWTSMMVLLVVLRKRRARIELRNTFSTATHDSFVFNLKFDRFLCNETNGLTAWAPLSRGDSAVVILTVALAIATRVISNVTWRDYSTAFLPPAIFFVLVAKVWAYVKAYSSVFPTASGLEAMDSGYKALVAQFGRPIRHQASTFGEGESPTKD